MPIPEQPLSLGVSTAQIPVNEDASIEVRHDAVDIAFENAREAIPDERHVDLASSAAGGDETLLLPAEAGNVDGESPLHDDAVPADGPATDPSAETGISAAKEMLDAMAATLQDADAATLSSWSGKLLQTIASLPDDAPQELLSACASMHTHVRMLELGQRMVADLSNRLDTLRHTEPSQRAAKLESMQETWDQLRVVTATLSRPAEGPLQKADALYRDDLEACARIMRSMVSCAMEGTASGSRSEVLVQGLSSEPVADALITLKLSTGAPIDIVATHVASAMTQASHMLSEADLRETLPAIIRELGRDRSPENVCAMVDLLFMDSYPGSLESALLLKKALVAQNPETLRNTELLHTLEASRRAVCNRLFNGAVPNTETAVSARSFLLTLDQMKKLAGDTGMRDMGYQIANLIALDVSVCRKGLLDKVLLKLNPGKTEADLPVLRETAARNTLSRAAGITELGVSRIVEALTGADASSAEAADLESAMIEAARRFSIGLMGLTDEERVGRSVAAGQKAVSSLADESTDALIYREKGAKAANLLDALTVKITGITAPSSRPVSGDPDGSKRRAMDGAMRLALAGTPIGRDATREAVGRELLFGKKGLDLSHADERMRSDLAKLGTLRRKVESAAFGMRSILPLEERRRAIAERLAILRDRTSAASLKAMKSQMKALGAMRSGKAAAQRFVAANHVLQAVRLQEKIDRLTEKLSGLADPSARFSELASLHVQLDKVLQSLNGIDPATLRPTGDPSVHPTVNQLKGVLAGARALVYLSTQWKDRDLKEIERLENELETARKDLADKMREARMFFGNETFFKLSNAVLAAYMDVFVRSGGNAETFDPRSESVQNLVRGRLTDWGLPQGRGGFLEVLLQRTAFHLSDLNGCLRTGIIDTALSYNIDSRALADAARKQMTSPAGKAGEAPSKAAAQEWRGLFERLRQENTQARRSRALGESLAGLGAGEGFSFDVSRGLSGGFELGPDTSGIVSANIVALTPSISVSILRQNEMAVHADGKGGFMVSLGLETSLSAGVSLEFALGNAALNAPGKNEKPPVADMTVSASLVSGKGELERGGSSGVMLHFSNAGDCTAFLMQTLSRGSSSEGKAPERVSPWLTADRVFLVQGGHVTKSFSAGIDIGTFEASTMYGKFGATAFSAKFESSGTTRHSTEQNSHGYTEVVEKSGQVRFTANRGVRLNVDLQPIPEEGAGAGLEIVGGSVDTTASPFKDPEYAYEPASVTTVSRTGRLYDGTITADSSVTLSTPRQNRGPKELLAVLGLDETQASALFASEKGAVLREAMESGEEESTVSVTWKLTETGLSRLRSLEASIRQAGRSGGVHQGKTVAQLRKEYAGLLADRSLYEPAELAVETKVTEKAKHNFSAFVYMQNRSYSSTKKTTVPLIG